MQIGRSFVAVKRLGGEPEKVLECMRQMHKTTLRQEGRVFSRMRWSPLPQDGSPVGLALAQARFKAGERAAVGFGQGSASMFPVVEHGRARPSCCGEREVRSR